MVKNPFEKKMTITLPNQHLWIRDVRGVSSIVEYLLDEKFGVDRSNNPEEDDILNARKMVEAKKILEIMRQRKLEGKQEG